jgi:hypothetical protein
MKTLDEINQEKERALMEAVYGNPFDQKIPAPEVYKLMLKRKRLGAILRQMMMEGGYDDLARTTKFTRTHLSEEDL